MTQAPQIPECEIVWFTVPLFRSGDYASWATPIEKRLDLRDDGYLWDATVRPDPAGRPMTAEEGRRPLPRRAAHVLIRGYQLTLSGLLGRQCRHLPTCSAYTDEAIGRHGLWAGGWMGAARICRCHPWGTSGFDPVPTCPDPRARWYLPWRYGLWRRTTPDNDETG